MHGPARAAFDAPPHMMDSSRTMAVWFTEPAGLVAQFARPARWSVPLAEWLVGPVISRLLKRFPGDQPLVFVLDLTQMNGRDPPVRQLVVEAARSLTHRARRAVVVPPENANRVYLAGVQAAASIARVFGLTVSIESLPEALDSLRAAPPGT